jgi:predicted RNA-binding Zn ribbon-like protein
VAEPYQGPIRDERLAIELHNTRYARDGTGVDALDDPVQARAWLAAVSRRGALSELPAGAGPTPDALRGLRAAIRMLVAATVAARPLDPAAVAAVNAACAAAPGVPRLRLTDDGPAVRETTFGDATRAAVVLAVIAADAIDLLAGPHRTKVRLCGAPGCVLAFVATHPRRTWCSDACGNRARQARHARRVRGGG